MKLASRLVLGAMALSQATAFANSDLLLDSNRLKSGAGGDSIVYIHQLQNIEAESHSALGFRAGTTAIRSFQFSNGTSRFTYADASATTLAFHWESTPVAALGHWGIYSGLSFATYGASMIHKQDGTSTAGGTLQTPARVSLLPASAGITYLADFHRVTRWLMPVASLGVDYALYLQSGSDGGDQMTARGAAWSLRKSVGLRHSLDWLGIRGAKISGDYVFTSNLVDSGPRFEGSSILVGVISDI